MKNINENTNLTEGLNEDVITPQNESNGQNDAANDSELKLTFLGTGIKDHKSSAEETIVKGQKFLRHTPILGSSLTITKNNTVYNSENGLVVDEKKGTFSVENVNLEGGVANYKYYNRIGLCAVLQVGGKTILFDVGGKHFGENAVIENPDGTFTDIITETENELVNFLTEQGIDGITKFVDAVVITHFHHDHVGDVEIEKDENSENHYRTYRGMEFLLKNKSNWFKNCTFYFPHQSNNKDAENKNVFNWSKFANYNKTYEGIKNTILGSTGYGNGIQGANIICPNEEGYNANIGATNTSIKFYNVDSKFYNEYFENKLNYIDEEKYTDKGCSYNNFSMVTIIEHCGNKIAITGDIEYLATKNMAKVMSEVDVVQIEHHDGNHRSHINYLNNITAKIGVIPTYTYYRNFNRHRPTTDKIISNGGKVFYTGDCGNVTVVSNEYGVYVENDVIPMPVHTSMSYNLNYGTKILTNEDLNNLTVPGVYCTKYYKKQGNNFDDLTNYPSEFECGSKIIVESITGNQYVLRQTVIEGDTLKPAIAYRNKNNDDNWSNWYYNYPSMYGKLLDEQQSEVGSYKISSNGEFEVWVRTYFTPTKSYPIEAGYYSNELYYSLKFLNDLGWQVENACVFGMSDYSYTVVNGEVLRIKDGQTEDKVKFRLLKSVPITVNSAKLASLLIKGKLVEKPEEAN